MKKHPISSRVSTCISIKRKPVSTGRPVLINEESLQGCPQIPHRFCQPKLLTGYRNQTEAKVKASAIESGDPFKEGQLSILHSDSPEPNALLDPALQGSKELAISKEPRDSFASCSPTPSSSKQRASISLEQETTPEQSRGFSINLSTERKILKQEAFGQAFQTLAVIENRAGFAIQSTLSHLLTQNIDAPIRVDASFLQKTSVSDRRISDSSRECRSILKNRQNPLDSPPHISAVLRPSVASGKSVRFCQNRVVIHFKRQKFLQDSSSESLGLHQYFEA